jgi:hypothetical protein
VVEAEDAIEQLPLFETVDGEDAAEKSESEIRRLIPAADDLRPSTVTGYGFSIGKSGGVLQLTEKGSIVQEARLNDVSQVNVFGSASMTSAEALASVVLEISDEPLVVSNVDLTEARIGGLGTDVARRFLERFAEGAGVTLHVRLLNGTETQHVLEAIFKALGVALAQATTEGGHSGR